MRARARLVSLDSSFCQFPPLSPNFSFTVFDA
jgi:hypothetical protein